MSGLCFVYCIVLYSTMKEEEGVEEEGVVCMHSAVRV